ncbi:MAG TPA: GDP-mannose 4,6-dehydratase, partial [Pyrinomonadaceae bacterium]
VDERFLRPAEVDLLVGDAGKAERELKWRPEYSFKELVKQMVEADLATVARESGRMNAARGV